MQRKGWGKLDALQIEIAVRRFFCKHNKIPAKISEFPDASPHFGLPDGTLTWNALDNRLHVHPEVWGYPPNFSLCELCVYMGLKKPPFTFSPEQLTEALQKYREAHGRYPHQQSGEASEYFGKSQAPLLGWLLRNDSRNRVLVLLFSRRRCTQKFRPHNHTAVL